MKNFSDDEARGSSEVPEGSGAGANGGADKGKANGADRALNSGHSEGRTQPVSSLSRALGDSYTPTDDEIHGGGFTRGLTEKDYQEDPLLRLERNNKSTRNAFVFFFGTIGLTLGVALAIALIGKTIGGPRCDAGEASWLCTQGLEIAFWVVPGVISFVAMFLSVYITYDKWRRHQRWRPWIAVIWFLMPYALGWMTSAGAALLLTQ
ncbi:hypothetical protein [uncultured Corynebacterium sp.]|uniref:hypothetical protein n=1 Tax=uncultured Corynebacterium sp. TaxID=159447 RepID=UPI0025DD9B00|nr:hypothetical protein [uncultured Corynebacterium sp.]